MKLNTLSSIVGLVTIPALGQSHTVTEKVHGVVVYSRHGDRQSKVYKGYQVTNLGAEQVYNSGSFYRSRYVEANATHKILGISSDVVKQSQLWVSGPDQAVLLQTATNFLQGLYPPLGEVNGTLSAQELSNGTETIAPLDGYQFVQIHAEDEKDPDTIWLKGSDSCPAWTKASATYRESTEYLNLLESSASFYSQFNEVLSTNLAPENISYANAYDVFDLINVAQIHNESDIVTSEQLNQLRYYANNWELNMNYNRTMPERSIGGATLGGAFLKQLNETVASQGKLKFTLMTGSYNTFLAFFGRVNLTTLEGNTNFTGLPDYASSMIFELVSSSEEGVMDFPAEKDLKVRFSFRNGTDASDELTAFPLFGQDQTLLPYSDFKSMMGERAITGQGEWCGACQQTRGFCSQPEFAATASNDGGSRMSNAVAGVIGALVTLGVVAIVGVGFLLARRRKSRKGAIVAPLERKTSSDYAGSREVPV